MSPATAILILTWAAIVILYLGLGAVLREVRLLRNQVSRLSAALEATPSDSLAELQLPTTVTEGSEAVVLVADSTCPSCRSALHALSELSDDAKLPFVLLTWEEESIWAGAHDGVRLVRDSDAWSALAHLSPPVLLRVTPSGSVSALTLPVDGEDVATTLATWGLLPASVRES